MKTRILGLASTATLVGCWALACAHGADVRAPSDRAALDRWAAKFRGWHYYPDHVISPKPEDGLGFHMTDAPLVFQRPGDQTWYMFYTGFDGRGYQTALAESNDLVHWTPKKLAMGFGREGAFDHGGVAFSGALFKSYELAARRTLGRFNGKY